MAIQAEQVYLTICAPNQGLRPDPGYYLRAASTQDPDLLRFALEWPRYELPLSQLAGVASADQAPRRLALVAGPGGRAVLLHSGCLLDQRGSNSFTHLLAYPQLAPDEALRTWGSPDWCDSCPAEQSTSLPPFPGVPRPGPICDTALTAFLCKTANVTGEQPLGRVIVPARLGGGPQGRLKLLVTVLHAYLLALADKTGQRRQLCLLAEPGLATMLLYGVVRLLPRGLTRGLTFSTYETARQARGLLAVGRYEPEPTSGPTRDHLAERSYAVDTFGHGRGAGEVGVDVPRAVTDLVALAATGKWDRIEEAHRLAGGDDATATSLDVACHVQRLWGQVSGQAGRPADLVALHRIPAGRALLKEQAAQAWPLVRRWAVAHESVRKEFRGMLRRHAPELRRLAAQALAADPARAWPARWQVVRALAEGDAAAARQELAAVVAEAAAAGTLPVAGLPVAGRLAALTAWREVGGEEAGDWPEALDGLRIVRGPDELEAWRGSGLPAEWQALAAARGVVGSQGAALREPLFAGEKEPMRATLAGALGRWPPDRQRQVLLALIPPKDSRALYRLDRLLAEGLSISGDLLDSVLEGWGGYEPGAREFWAQGEHLAHLLESLQKQRATAGRVWERFLKGIRVEWLFGNTVPSRLLGLLQGAAERLGPAVPPGARQTLADWAALQDVFTEAEADVPSRGELAEVCQRLGVEPRALLREHFAQVVCYHPRLEEAAEPLAGAVLAFSRPCRQPADSEAACALWLEIVEECPDPARKEALQVFFLKHRVPAGHREAVARELDRQGRLAAGVVAAAAPAALPEVLPVELPEVLPVTETESPLPLVETVVNYPEAQPFVPAGAGGAGGWGQVGQKWRRWLGLGRGTPVAGVELLAMMADALAGDVHQVLEELGPAILVTMGLHALEPKVRAQASLVDDLVGKLNAAAAAGPAGSPALDSLRDRLLQAQEEWARLKEQLYRGVRAGLLAPCSPDNQACWMLTRIVEHGEAAGSYDFLAAAWLAEVRLKGRLNDAQVLRLGPLLDTYRQARNYAGAAAARRESLRAVTGRMIEFLAGTGEPADQPGRFRRRLAAFLRELGPMLEALEDSPVERQRLRQTIDELAGQADNGPPDEARRK